MMLNLIKMLVFLHMINKCIVFNETLSHYKLTIGKMCFIFISSSIVYNFIEFCSLNPLDINTSLHTMVHLFVFIDNN